MEGQQQQQQQHGHGPYTNSMVGGSVPSTQHSDIGCSDARPRNRAMTTGSIQHHQEEKNTVWLAQHRPLAGDGATAASAQKQEEEEELSKQQEEIDGHLHQPGELWAPHSAAQPSHRALPGATSYRSGVPNAVSRSTSVDSFLQRNGASSIRSSSSTGYAAVGTGAGSRFSTGTEMAKDAEKEKPNEWF